ncbi:LPS export ABC transporter periplasmic protein LptC [Xinfangfangia sp. D13-10-4-6]|uniref:LPS export ABC transporter periplasmic protein LptC n=1 Tax=Pseudogemmobacter hezensis TaxID=2737662 RepID=UPI001553ED74|nr:LPS export ABC transporter periplasmic protein LptC [Pseudogemmobacter hezensis]NPD14165.1 LPS export ABC transporter periplasmic protein LptC [Pseudogemmobacter hezensis]
MPRADRHSRLVGWLKVALPLSALALLSTMFLLADRIDTDAAIHYAQVDVEDLARDPRMTTPTYAGTTSDGAAITMTATAARPATGTRSAGASDVTVRLDMPGGGSTDIRAKEAVLDTAASQLRLTGGVGIDTSSGYHIVTDVLTAALDRSGAKSEAPVNATGPQVTLTANSFSLQRQDKATGEQDAQPKVESADTNAVTPYLLVFSGAVKLVYEPGGPRRETDAP